MCEVLRVQAGFESDWIWTTGVDTTNKSSEKYIKRQETGAFQVSADSMDKDKSLRSLVIDKAGNDDPQRFIDAMKNDHALAVEYVTRLLRFSTRWCGTINDPDQVLSYVKREAVEEFISFLRKEMYMG